MHRVHRNPWAAPASLPTTRTGIREPPTDPDNHLNDNCRQRGINCRPRNKLHVPVTASILVTRPPIAALAALPSPPSPLRHQTLDAKLTMFSPRSHCTQYQQQQQQQRSSNILLYQESSSIVFLLHCPTAIDSYRFLTRKLARGTLNTLESKRKRRGEQPLWSDARAVSFIRP